MLGAPSPQWDPLPVAEAVALFAPAPFRWWLSGGHALEAHLGRSWRHHDDTDIGLARADAPHLVELLDGWDIRVAAGGVLAPWDGQPPSPQRSENNLWCRPDRSGPWVLDLTLGDGDDDHWTYRRDPSVRRPWSDVVLATVDGLPYLAPELQLLFKSNDTRPKDDIDAGTVIPDLSPERRSWLADHLPADHRWQTTIARVRAHQVLGAGTELLASGRASQAWGGEREGERWVVRVPIPNSGRTIGYRSEALIGQLLTEAGQPVCPWRIETAGEVECSVGPLLEGTPIDYVDDSTPWSPAFADAVATVLRHLHRLPAQGWGPLENRSDALVGTSESANQGVVDRWFHAPMWPFDGSDLDHHPLAVLDPEAAARFDPLRDAILAAACEPYGVVHSDLHRQHLLQRDGRLTGLLDFGDAYIGSTAWDLGAIHWYYGEASAERVAQAYEPESDLAERASLLAIAIGCYKIAKAHLQSRGRTHRPPDTGSS